MNNHGAITIVARQCRSAPLPDPAAGSPCHLEVDLYGVDLHDFVRRLTPTQRKQLLNAPTFIIDEGHHAAPDAATGTPPVDLAPLTGGTP